MYICNQEIPSCFLPIPHALTPHLCLTLGTLTSWKGTSVPDVLKCPRHLLRYPKVSSPSIESLFGAVPSFFSNHTMCF